MPPRVTPTLVSHCAGELTALPQSAQLDLGEATFGAGKGYKGKKGGRNGVAGTRKEWN